MKKKKTKTPSPAPTASTPPKAGREVFTRRFKTFEKVFGRAPGEDDYVFMQKHLARGKSEDGKEARMHRRLALRLRHCEFALGYFLDREFRDLPPSRASRYFEFCLAKAFSTLRSVRTLLRKERGGDSLSLLRSLYESYLQVLFTRQVPEEAQELARATAGLKSGTHRYPHAGKNHEDRRQIIEVRTGKVRAIRTNFTIAQQSAFPEDRDLFETLYPFLTEYIRPEQIDADTGLFEYRAQTGLAEARFFALFLSVLILDLAKESASPAMQRDLEQTVARAARTLRKYAPALAVPTELSNATHARLERVLPMPSVNAESGPTA
jgi:hypothetical protein